MIEVTLYSRTDCHLCEIVKQNLEELQTTIPHILTIIDVDTDPKLKKMYGFNVPVVIAGPYKLSAPIDKKDLEIALLALKHGQEQDEELDKAIKSGELQIPVQWTKADSISLWLAKHYLAIFNILIFIYVGLPFVAPVLMKVGVESPAKIVYKAYGFVCHQLAFRSWFLFGEQYAYPREAAGIDRLASYEEVTGLDSYDLLAARDFIGNPELGYKVALCQRDVAIYGGILIFGVVFGLTRRKIKSLHILIWIFVGIVPIAIDGLSQLISQPPFQLIPYRESTPLFRSLSGFLFGFMTAWFGYPYIEESMSENRKYIEQKFIKYSGYEKDKEKSK